MSNLNKYKRNIHLTEMLALFPNVEDTKKDPFRFLRIQEKVNVSSRLAREHVL